MDEQLIRALRCGAHLELDTRWLRFDGTNYMVYSEFEIVKIIYSGKDLDRAVDVLITGKVEK